MARTLLQLCCKQADQLSAVSVDIAAANSAGALSFDGLQPNTDYVVLLIARDKWGNCQAAYTSISVHTADNIPPVTLLLRADNVTGTSADLLVSLDEPGTAYFAIVDAAARADTPCPSVSDIFAGNSAAGVITGNLSIPERSPAFAVATLRDLRSQTAFVACVVAQDATQLHNRQSSALETSFTTLDITPPTVNISLLPGSDGDVSCYHAAPYTCNASWTITISEPGAARWALVHSSGLPAVAPRPSVMLAAPSPDVALGNGSSLLAAGDITFTAANSAAVIAATRLPNKANFTLLVAARDSAQPAPNVPLAVAGDNITAPDVQPPAFLNASLALAADTALTFALLLDVDAVTHYVLMPSPSVAPSRAEVLAGVGNNHSVAIAAGNISCGAQEGSSLVVSGLIPGQPYDLHMIAVDTAGNSQTSVTSLK